jgi:hypothetical protein
MTSVLDDASLTDFERRLPTEAADIDEIVRGMRAVQQQAAEAGNRPLSRGTHAKGLCVQAEFEVLDISRSHRARIPPLSASPTPTAVTVPTAGATSGRCRSPSSCRRVSCRAGRASITR